MRKNGVKTNKIKQHKALVALMQCSTKEEVCEQAGITRATLRLYMNQDPGFMALYERMKRAQLEHVITKVQTAADKAIDYMVQVMENENESTTTRLSAAFKIVALQAAFSATGQRSYQYENRHEGHFSTR